MATPIVVPGLGESVTEATVAKWMKKVGDPVKADEALAELETDKVTQELYAPTAGTLGEITAPEGSVVAIGAVIGQITDGAVAAAAPAKPAPGRRAPAGATRPQPAAGRETSRRRDAVARRAQDGRRKQRRSGGGRRHRQGRPPDQGRRDRASGKAGGAADFAGAAARPRRVPRRSPKCRMCRAPSTASEERVPMTRLRRRIAERLKQAQNTAAMLTTFNEVDMGAVMACATNTRRASRSATR